MKKENRLKISLLTLNGILIGVIVFLLLTGSDNSSYLKKENNELKIENKELKIEISNIEIERDTFEAIAEKRQKKIDTLNKRNKDAIKLLRKKSNEIRLRRNNDTVVSENLERIESAIERFYKNSDSIN